MEDLLVAIHDSIDPMTALTIGPRLASFDEALTNEIRKDGATKKLQEIHAVRVPIAILIRHKETRSSIRLNMPIRLPWNPPTDLPQQREALRIGPGKPQIDPISIDYLAAIGERKDASNNHDVPFFNDVEIRKRRGEPFSEIVQCP